MPKEEGATGFRDLGKFNIAFLAKRGWRLMDNPDSLSTRILLAKYFQNSTFLESSLGSGSSLIWRSIWSSKALLHSGLGWRIGKG